MMLLILLFILMLFRHYVKTHLTRQARLVNKFPGSPIAPFLGSAYIAFTTAENLQNNLSACFLKYGRLVAFWWFSEAKIVVGEASACEKILSSKSLIEKGLEYALVKDALGNGLITAPVERWRKDRMILNPSFKRQLMDGFLQIFNKRSKVLVRTLQIHFATDMKPINLYPHLTNATLEMIFESALGTELNILETKGDHRFAEAFEVLTAAAHVRLFKPYWLFIPMVYKWFGNYKAEQEAMECIVGSFIQPALRNKRLELEKTTPEKDADFSEYKQTKPFIEVLLESNLSFTEQDCIDHLITIVFAGTDTTATSINNTLFFLALYPEHQRKVQEEIDTILGDDFETEITTGALASAKYLEMCWKESLRLKPPIPVITRRLLEDVKLDNGLIMPEGADAVFMIYDIHRDPKVFPDPELFDPTRFTVEAISSRPKYSYLPFSMGIRNCIGSRFAAMEAKVILMHILRRFTVSTNQKQGDIKSVYGIALISHPAIKLALRERRQ